MIVRASQERLSLLARFGGDLDLHLPLHCPEGARDHALLGAHQLHWRLCHEFAEPCGQ